MINASDLEGFEYFEAKAQWIERQAADAEAARRRRDGERTGGRRVAKATSRRVAVPAAGRAPASVRPAPSRSVPAQARSSAAPRMDVAAGADFNPFAPFLAAMNAAPFTSMAGSPFAAMGALPSSGPFGAAALPAAFWLGGSAGGREERAPAPVLPALSGVHPMSDLAASMFDMQLEMMRLWTLNACPWVAGSVTSHVMCRRD